MVGSMSQSSELASYGQREAKVCGGRAHCAASPRPRKLPGLVGRSPVEPTSTRDASGRNAEPPLYPVR